MTTTTTQIDWDAERKRFKKWFAERFDESYIAPSTAKYFADMKSRYWIVWEAALTYSPKIEPPKEDAT